MSVQATSWVWRYSKSTGTDRLVALAVADAANATGGASCQSVETLAAMVGVTDRTVQRSLRALVEMGELVQVGVHPRYRTMTYAFPAIGIIPEDPSDPGGQVGRGGDTNVTGGVTNEAPHPPGGVTPVSPNPKVLTPKNKTSHRASSALPGDELVLVDVPPTPRPDSPVQALVGAYAERCRGRASSSLLGGIGRTVKRLLETDKFPPELILAAIDEAAPLGRRDLDRIIAAPGGPAARYHRAADRQRMFARWRCIASSPHEEVSA